MSASQKSDFPSPSLAERVDAACDRFEAAWKGQQKPRIEDFLAGLSGPDQTSLLCELLVLELGYRQECGEEATFEEYRQRFPENDSVVRDAFAKFCPSPPTVSAAALEMLPPYRAPVPDEVETRTGPAPRALLEVIAGPHLGQRLEYDCHDTLLVGRGSAAQLRLANDPHFSRNHFLLEINPPNVLMRDLGSRNGTFVNGEKVRQCRLKPGDVVSGGQTRIRFTLLDVLDEIATADWPKQPADASAPRLTRLLPGVERTAPHVNWAAGSADPQAPTPEAKALRTTAPLVNIPGYEIVRKLGQGGMGMVYLARHLGTRAPVALKIMVPESTANDRALNLFFREARVLSQLHHPHIVAFRDMGLHLGQVFLAMEHVETIDWKSLLAKQSLASRSGMVCAALCQVLEGLHYAHQQGFVHRDLKPSNVLVARGDTNRPLLAKLADFGLAKNFENAGLSGMTHEGQALGTIPFMAPEQVASARDARPAVDIYAAGATLYYLLSGAHPYNFPGGAEPLLIILEEPPIPLRRRCPDISADLAGAIDHALAKKSRNRFATAEDLRQALLPHAVGAF